MYDLGAASVTSVSNILAVGFATTQGSTSFVISGPGFSGGAGGAVTVNVNTSNVADTSTLVSAINAGILAAGTAGTAQSQAFAAANITAQIHTGADGAQQLQFVSASTAFQVTAGDATANSLMGNLTGQTNAGTGTALGLTALSFTTDEAANTASAFIAGGTQQTVGAVYTNLAFSTTTNGTASGHQTLTFVANNSAGTPQTVKVTLNAGTVAAMTAAQAVAAINTALQATDNPALENIIATTDGGASGVGKIEFTSNSTTPFNVTIGQEVGDGTVANFATNGVTGIAGYNTIIGSSATGVGATSDISTQTGAESAVSALANSVALLGQAQAVVGRGENLFNYAVNLAQSQLTNLAAAESSIRDADLATEAANLTKAQILLQAGVAALAQANSAPQNILSLLKG
jgi:flagellin